MVADIDINSILLTLGRNSLIWATSHEILYRAVPFPDSIKNEKDKKKQIEEHNRYVSDLVALVQAPVTIAVSIYLQFTVPWDYGSDNQPLQRFIPYVRPKI